MREKNTNFEIHVFFSRPKYDGDECEGKSDERDTCVNDVSADNVFFYFKNKTGKLFLNLLINFGFTRDE